MVIKIKNIYDQICKRTLRTFNNYYDIIFSEINENIKSKNDLDFIFLSSLFVISYDIIKNSINLRNKNDYYSSNILILKIYENVPVYYKIDKEQNFEEFKRLSKIINDKDKFWQYSSEEQEEYQKKFNDISGIKSAIFSFGKLLNYNKNERKILYAKYEILCCYKHLNLLKIGQYKHYSGSLNLGLKGAKTYDLETDKETINHIIHSFDYLMRLINYKCPNNSFFKKIKILVDRNSEDYDKTLF